MSGPTSGFAETAVATAHPVMGKNAGEEAEASPRMFFTTSDLVERMNAAMADAEVPSQDGGGFELQRKLPDGSYRRAEESEMAAADFQAKMKQASGMIKDLDPRQKIEWATHQRKEGNALFARGEYKEAMDVYLTCLVAMDGQQSDASTDDQVDEEIKLPVLLNLALSALKLGMPSKAEQFCNYALETEAGQRSVKAYFRRGRVRMLMGHYVSAELDLDKALDLNAERADADGSDEAESERKTILREKQKLTRLINQAEKNQRQQKKAMEKLFQSEEMGDRVIQTGLYPEKKEVVPTRQEDPDPLEEHLELSCFQWYVRMIGRCAEKLLDIIGHEDEGDVQDIPVDRDLLNSLMNQKKNA
ncbi:hypothetical protein ACHAXT_009587 [Thalassiosira profunda]